MRKILIVLMAVCSLAFTSCLKESEYTVTYVGGQSEYANVTAFEYSGTTLVAKREMKYIEPDVVYPITSSDMADHVVIGVEAVVTGHIITEWYCSDVYRLDPDATTDIVVDFVTMPTSDVNPVNPDDHVSRYLY